MYLIFLFVLVLALFLTYILFQKDIFAPPTMMILVFLVSAILLLARYDDWRVNEYSVNACVLLFIGIISFVLGGVIAFYVIQKITIQNRRIGSVLKKSLVSRIDISLIWISLAIIMGVLEVKLLYRYICHTVVTMNYNHSSLASLLYSYRWVFINNLIPAELGMPRYLGLLKYTVEVISAFSIYVFLHNIILKCYKKRDFIYFAIVLFWPLNAILTSSRGDIITLLAEAIYLIYFFFSVNRGFSMMTSLKVINKGVKILIAFLVFFFGFAVFQNRINSNNTLMNSITIYISGGIRAFDLFVKEPLEKNMGLIGNDETLRYFSMFLAVHMHRGEKTLLPLEFRYIDGKSIGNIFTAFRRYYSDFGIVGIVIFSIILGLVMSLLYAKSKKACIYKKNAFVILLFSWLSKPIFYMAMEDYFYVSNISMNSLYKILVLYLLYLVFVEKRKFVRFRSEKNGTNLFEKKCDT